MVGKIHFADKFSEDRLEFETLISDLSSRFINLQADELDGEIELALQRVCEALALDLAVLWQWSAADPSVIAPTHAYPRLDSQFPPDPLRQEQYPWTVEQMQAGRMVTIPSLEKLPAEAAVDRESARLNGINSSLCLPLGVEGQPPVGALAFNTLLEERDWPDDLVNRLQLISQIFTNSMARTRQSLNLQESQERLALAAESADAGFWTLDFGTRLFWATDRCKEIFGYRPDEVITFDRFMASIHPDDRDFVHQAIDQSRQGDIPINLEYRITLPGDESVRWIASLGRSQFTSTGELERLMGISVDVTERKINEEAFRANESRLAAGAELAGLGFYEVDFSQGTMYHDHRLADLCGIPPDQARGLQPIQFWLDHVHPDDTERVEGLRQELHDGRLEKLSFEYRYLHSTRGEVWIHHLAGVTKRDAVGNAVATYGVLRDITEQKQTEDELRDLSQRLIQAHEDERALLARELHDDVTQRLAVLAIDVGRAERDAPDGEQTQAMQSIREKIVSISEDIHTLAYQLHPSVLQELGLVEALRAECERRSRQCKVDLSVDLDQVPAGVGKDAALCLFRVAQESLNNMSRHAEARTATIGLRKMDDGLRLSIRDDGVGFDSEGSKKRMSLGLASMRERVRLVDGTLDIKSAPGKGTEIIAWIPVLWVNK